MLFDICWHQLPHGANCLTSCRYQVRVRSVKLVEQTEARVGSYLCSLLNLCKVLSISSIRETTETMWEELCRDSLREFLPRMCTVTVSFYISTVHFIPLWSVGRKNNDCDYVDIFALFTRNVSDFQQLQCFWCQLTGHLVTVVSMCVNLRCSAHGQSAEFLSGLLHMLSPIHHPDSEFFLTISYIYGSCHEE